LNSDKKSSVGPLERHTVSYINNKRNGSHNPLFQRKLFSEKHSVYTDTNSQISSFKTDIYQSPSEDMKTDLNISTNDVSNSFNSLN